MSPSKGFFTQHKAQGEHYYEHKRMWITSIRGGFLHLLLRKTYIRPIIGRHKILSTIT
jgi:hypothetical protein